MLRLTLLFAVIVLYTATAFAQDTVKLHFLYGSKPARGYKQTESKHFGGIKGGHVNIEANGKVLDFMPGKCPLFPNNRKPSGGFVINHDVYWDTSSAKWTTILIPVTRDQLRKFDSLTVQYTRSQPFDYAVFGMRCASATYYVLSEMGLFETWPRRQNIFRHFYPKLLRKRILKWARKKNYPIIRHSGNRSRKWEKDAGPV